MEVSYNKYGATNPFELKKSINEKSRLNTLYKNIDSLDSIVEFMKNDSQLVKETIFSNPIPKNKEVIQYIFVEDNCFYNNSMIKQIIEYSCENNHLDILNTLKERHPDLLNKSEYHYFSNDLLTEKQKETFSFMVENTSTFENLNNLEKTNVLTELLNDNKLENFDLLIHKNPLKEKDFIIQNSKDLSLDGMNNLINHCNISNEQIKNLFINSCYEKGDCRDENINIFIDNDFSLNELEVENEAGGYGNKLLSSKYEFLNTNYQFDKETYQKAFEKCIDNENLETAKNLLETNEFKPKISTLMRIEKKYPQFDNYYKKHNLKQNIENKLTPKLKSKSLDNGLKI